MRRARHTGSPYLGFRAAKNSAKSFYHLRAGPGCTPDWWQVPFAWWQLAVGRLARQPSAGSTSSNHALTPLAIAQVPHPCSRRSRRCVLDFHHTGPVKHSQLLTGHWFTLMRMSARATAPRRACPQRYIPFNRIGKAQPYGTDGPLVTVRRPEIAPLCIASYGCCGGLLIRVQNCRRGWSGASVSRATSGIKTARRASKTARGARSAENAFRQEIASFRGFRAFSGLHFCRQSL